MARRACPNRPAVLWRPHKVWLRAGPRRANDGRPARLPTRAGGRRATYGKFDTIERL